MASKNHATLKVDADTKGAVSGIDKVTAKLNAMSKEAKSQLDGFSKLGNAISGFKSSMDIVSGAIDTGISIIKGYCAALHDAANAYNTQLKAEKQLEIAVNNNPYMTGAAATGLKNFASELQAASVYGDEVTIPMMAKLAAEGKTESEVMDIMSAAVDYAAGTGTDLSSAVQALSASLNGNTGALGRTNEAVKNLTSEQLRNGDAIKLIKEQYGGMAKSIADATGAEEQFNNTFGDLKEKLGVITKPAVDGWYRFWDSVAQKGQAVLSALDAWATKLSLKISFSENSKDLASFVKNISAKEDAAGQSLVSKQTDVYLEGIKSLLEAKGNLSSEENDALMLVKTELSYRERLAKAMQAEAAAAAEEKRKKELVQKCYHDVVNAKIKEIALRKAAGEAISAESEAQQIANTKMSAYLSYLRAGGAESENLLADVKKSYKELAQFTKSVSTPKKDVLSDALKAYDASIKKVKDEIKYRRQLGEVISETEEKEKVLAAMRSGYITLRQSAGSTLTDMSETSRAILASADALEKQLKPIQELKKAYEELSKAGKNYVDSLNLDDRSEADKLRESVQAQITKINEMLGDDSGGISEEAVKAFYKKWRAYMDKYSGKGLTAEAYASLIGGNKKLTENQKDFMRDFEATFKSAGRSAEELAELNKELEEYNALLEAVKFTDVYGSFKSELEKISLDDTRSQLEKLKEQLSGLDEIAAAAHEEINRLLSSDNLSDDDSKRLSAMISLMEEYKEKRIQIEKDITEATEAEYLEQVKKVQEVFSKIQSALGNLQSAASTLSQVFTKQAEDEATVESAKIEEQYASGLLSYEEYQKKKEAIDKEAAQKAYKAQMWAWSLEVLSATSGIASSLIQVLADKTLPTWAKIAMSATVGAAGAAQLASVIASKPTPPNFATGGIVGGNSYHGDKVQANVNSGEMILNARQQAQLWKTANESRAGGSGALSVQIKNYRGNDTRATPSLDGDRLTIVIDGTVNRSMSNGNYNKSLVTAQNGLDGSKYEN